MIFIIIGAIILVSGVFFLLTFYSKKKFLSITIKLNEAQNNMDIILEKKIELFNRLITQMKKKKIDGNYPDINQCKEKKMEHHELHNVLFNVYTEIIQLVEEHEDKLKDDKSISLLDQLSDNEDDLIATVKYYNDNATDYNYLLHHFPTSLGALLFHFKQLELFKNEKRETFEILKEK